MWSNSSYLPGIDVSHHQGIIDWQQVKESGVEYSFLKATEGIDFLDEHFHNNWSNTRRAGVVRGAYHFFVPNEDPTEQAHYYLNAVGDILHTTDLPPVIDVESSPKYIYDALLLYSIEERQQMLQTWLDVVAQATNRVPMIYTNLYTWKIMWGDTEDFIQYPLWIANIEVETPSIPANQWGDKGFTFWQFSFEGSVPGILNGAAAVDQNVFEGNIASLKYWIGDTQERKLPPIIFNYQMFEAFSLSAPLFNQTVEEWILKTGLNYLNKASIADYPYDGPAVEDLSLSTEEKGVLEENVQLIITAYKETIYTRLTNQEMINAIYQAAKNLDLAGWTLLEKVELTDIVNNRDALYTGPKVDEMDQLSDEEKYFLAEALGLNLADFDYGQGEDPEEDFPQYEEPEYGKPPIEDPDEGDPVPDEPVVPPDSIFGFPEGTTNQDVINAIYEVAELFELTGWALLEFAGLTNLINDRDALYTGVMIDEMANLSTQQKEALAEILGVVLIDNSSETPREPDLEIPTEDPITGENVETGIEGGDEVSATYPGITNQDMLESFSNAEKLLDLQGGILIYNAELQSIADAPDSFYSGPIVKNMTGLSVNQRAVLLEMILEQGNSEGTETYPGLVNQDIINAFYQAATGYSENGWDWINLTRLTYMASSREMRYKPYRGPKIEDMAELSVEKRQTLTDLIKINQSS